VNHPPQRNMDFICPFADGGSHCPEVLSPAREMPSHRERKLFTLMNRPEQPTKNACPHCSLFLRDWKHQVGFLGHFKYFWIWWKQKEVREPRPQQFLQRGG